ncbi:hypothetical protein GCM10018952_28120 [Streptosporangium vulgare]
MVSTGGSGEEVRVGGDPVPGDEGSVVGVGSGSAVRVGLEVGRVGVDVGWVGAVVGRVGVGDGGLVVGRPGSRGPSRVELLSGVGGGVGCRVGVLVGRVVGLLVGLADGVGVAAADVAVGATGGRPEVAVVLGVGVGVGVAADGDSPPARPVSSVSSPERSVSSEYEGGRLCEVTEHCGLDLRAESPRADQHRGQPRSPTIQPTPMRILTLEPADRWRYFSQPSPHDAAVTVELVIGQRPMVSAPRTERVRRTSRPAARAIPARRRGRAPAIRGP